MRVNKIFGQANALYAFLLLCLGAGQHVVYRDKVAGYSITSIKKFYDKFLSDPTNTASELVYNNLIKDDYIKGHILLTYGDAIYTMNLNTKEVHHIAGKASTSGYVEGNSTAAEFNTITGLLTSPVDYPNNIWIVDSLNYCIRSLNRSTNVTSRFAGQCTRKGARSGDAKPSQFGEIITVTNSAQSKYYYYALDKYVYKVRIRQLFLTTASPTWQLDHALFLNIPDVMSAVFDSQGKLFYIVSKDAVHSYTVPDLVLEPVLESSARGHNDGLLKYAKVYGLSHMVLLNNDVFVITDSDNFRLRVVDLKNRTISSICGENRELRPSEKVFVPGSISICRLNYVTHIMKHPTARKLLFSGKELYEVCLTDQKTCDKKPVPVEQQIKMRKPADPATVSSSTVAAVVIATLAVVGVVAYRKRRARANIPTPTEGSMASPDSLISVLRGNASKAEVPPTSGSHTSVPPTSGSHTSVPPTSGSHTSVRQNEQSREPLGTEEPFNNSQSLRKVPSVKSQHLADVPQSVALSISSKSGKREEKSKPANKLNKKTSKSNTKQK